MGDGDKHGTVECLAGLAAVGLRDGQPEHAARLLGAAAWREVIGSPPPPSQRAEYNRLRMVARASLDEATFATMWAAGRALSLEDAVAEALQETREG